MSTSKPADRQVYSVFNEHRKMTISIVEYYTSKRSK